MMKYLYLIKTSPYIGIIITIVAYMLAIYIFRKSKNFFLLNPLLLGTVFCIVLLNWLNISYVQYRNGAKVLEFFLTPAIVSLGFIVYKHWNKIQSQLFGIILCVIVACFVSIVTSYFVAVFTHLGHIKMSIVSHNAFLPVALRESRILGGSAAWTSLFVIMNALVSYGLAPYIFQLLRVGDPLVRSITMGATFNIYGVYKAVDEGDESIAFTTVAFVCSSIMIFYVMPFALKFVRWIL